MLLDVCRLLYKKEGGGKRVRWQRRKESYMAVARPGQMVRANSRSAVTSSRGKTLRPHMVSDDGFEVSERPKLRAR